MDCKSAIRRFDSARRLQKSPVTIGFRGFFLSEKEPGTSLVSVEKVSCFFGRGAIEVQLIFEETHSLS